MTKILVIEDEAAVRENILELLSLEGFEVFGAANGEDGIDRAKQVRPNLILCDIRMPGTDGYEVLERVAVDPEIATIPFIFLTAKTELDDRRLGMELGADDYLTKPCKPLDLLNAIRARLNKHELYMQRYRQEYERAEGLKQSFQKLQWLSDSREDLLCRITEELRDPMSNVNLAIKMLQESTSDEARDRYLSILQQECAREIAIINELANLKNFTSPENIKLLHRFNLLNKNGRSPTN